MKKLLGIVVLGLLLSTSVYANCIQGDCNNGQGTWLFKNGDKYIGEHKNDLPNGFGTIKTKEASIEGNFKDGQLNGLGTIIFITGKVIKGKFKDGDLIEIIK